MAAEREEYYLLGDPQKLIGTGKNPRIITVDGRKYFTFIASEEMLYVCDGQDIWVLIHTRRSG